MTALITEVKQRPLESFRNIKDLTERAAMENMTVSALLETVDPTDAWSGEDAKMDAFERVLAASEIRTTSDEGIGIYADRFGRFFETQESRALGVEYASRVWRGVKTGKSVNTRFLLASAIQTVSVGARPYIEAATIDAERDAIDLPLNDLIALDNRVAGTSYRAIRLDEPNSMFHGSRANEGGELPRAKLALSDSEVFLQKYGNAIEWTYEAVSQNPIDVIGFFIRQLAVQAEYDKLDDVIDILANDPMVQVDNLEDLDPAAFESGAVTGDRGTFTMRALMAENMKFKRGPQMNTLLANDDTVLDFLMTPVGGTVSRPLAETNSTPLGPIQRLGTQNRSGFSYAGTASAPTDKIIFLDRNAAIERISRIGGDVSETAKFITRQTEVMTLSEYEQFHVVRPSAVRIVNLLKI